MECFSDLVQAPGQTLVPTVPGLVGNSLRLLRLAAKSIISTEPWRKDPSVVNLPWREKLESTAHEEGLTLGLLADDGIVAPQPPMARALQMAATAFKKAGHNVSYFKRLPVSFNANAYIF